MTAVRFAPSPTGRLHVGNARVALVNWLFARREGGDFVLRIDDTDTERSRLEYEQAIETDLAWLGITWDRKANQSARAQLYEEAADRLRAAGRLYPCYETPEELEAKRRRTLARRAPPIYDRAALTLTPEARAKYEDEGRKPHWRFLLAPGEVYWGDLIRGQCQYRASLLSDPVLIRADGTMLYTLPSVFDDIDLGITHVIRGEDHVTNTAVQIQIFEALGATPPAFAHLPLLTDATGQGLSKRLGSLALSELREHDIEPMSLVSVLAKLGTSDAIHPRQSIDELAHEFDFAKFGRATPRFDVEELEHLNGRLIHDMPFAAVAERLAAVGIDADATFWEAVRHNLGHFGETAQWWHICRGAVTPAIEDGAFLDQAASLLPADPWDGGTWAAWTERLRQETGRKGRDMYHPLRMALTGLPHGPELKTLLPLIGRERAIRRLRGETA